MPMTIPWLFFAMKLLDIKNKDIELDAFLCFYVSIQNIQGEHVLLNWNILLNNMHQVFMP